jgi:hypothetical protein
VPLGIDGQPASSGENMSHRFTYALGSTLVLVLIVGVGFFSLNSRSPAQKSESTTTTSMPVHLTLAPVGIWSGKSVIASQGHAVGSVTLGTLPANNGYTLVYDCSAPGSLRVSIPNTMSVSMRCDGRAVSMISWSNVPSAHPVRVSATSSLWRIAIYLTKTPVPLPNYEMTNI